MIANLFTRTFLIDMNSYNYNGISRFPIYEYKSFEKNEDPYLFYSNMKDTVLKDNTSSYNFITVVDRYDFDTALVDYMYFICMRYEGYRSILDHALLYEDMLLNKAKFISSMEYLDDERIDGRNNISYITASIQHFYEKYKDYDINTDMNKKIEFYKDLPVEYLYTIYRDWKDSLNDDYREKIVTLINNKIRSLWLYEIIYIWNRYQMYYYNSGYIKPLKLQNTIKDMLTSGKYSELKDLLDKNDYLIEEIKKTVRYDKKFDLDTSIFDMSMEDYLLYPSCKGYTDMNLFKFNNSMLKRFREKSDDK